MTHDRTLDALAAHMHVTRPAIPHRRKTVPEYFVKTAAGWDVALAEQGRARLMAESRQARAKGPEVEELRARKLRLECEMIQAWLDVTRSRYALVADVLAEFREMAAQARIVFSDLGAEVAPLASGQSPAEVEELLREAVDA